MNKQNTKGMFRRTFRLYTKFKVPWHLYVLETVLSLISTRIALLYIPYESQLKTGAIREPGVLRGFLLFSLLNVIVTILARIPEFYASALVTRNLQKKTVRHALYLPMRAYEKNASRIVSWITNDCSFAHGLITSLCGFITGIAAAYMSLRSMSLIDIAMISVLPAVFLYVLFSTWLEGKLLFLRERIGRESLSVLTAYFAEHMGFFFQVRQLHAEEEEKARGYAAIDAKFKTEVRQEILTVFDSLVSGSVVTVINILVFVFGIPKVRAGNVSLAELAAFQNYVLIAYNSLSSLPALYTSLMYYNGELFYIAGLMDEKEEEYRRQLDMEENTEDIRFDQVSFQYDETPVLKNVSLCIPAGKTTLIAGENGSGKSTVFKLIQRLYVPDDGKIYLGERDAESIHLDAWRKKMCCVMQTAQLFQGTIRENILFGMDEACTEEELVHAAKLANAHGFIMDLPGGYDFEIGDNGSKLSAGQKQRIAIARAVILDPAYLFLDEATCNMDVLSEQVVYDALMRLMQGRTVVMISHDMRMIEMADEIIVLNHGMIEAGGRKEEVMRQSKTLQDLVSATE